MLPSGLDKPDRFVSPDDIRSLFNGLGLYEKATTGQLDQEVYDEYATPERAGQLRGTVTQIVIYYERLPSGARRPVLSCPTICNRMASLGQAVSQTRNGCAYLIIPLSQ